MIVVVTALFGPAESAPPVGPKEVGTRYVCFTDREAPGWECRPDPSRFIAAGGPRLGARWVKTHVHDLLPDADVSIWMDASFDLLVPPSEIVAAAGAYDIAGFVHPDRTRIDEEMRECVRLGLAIFEEAGYQVKTYFDDGFVDQIAITTTGLLVRRHTAAVARFNLQWWSEQANHTQRDQLSVDYVAWKTGVRIGYLPGHYRDNRFARYNRHRHRERRVA